MTARAQDVATVRGSVLEMQFAEQIAQAGLPQPEREYLFAKSIGRKWRFDFAWLPQMIAVELEGGVFKQDAQGHNSVSGITRDIDKGNAAVALGWRLYRFHAGHLNSNAALRTITQALEEA